MLQLPSILEIAGFDLRRSTIVCDWDMKVASEIKRRTSLKRPVPDRFDGGNDNPPNNQEFQVARSCQISQREPSSDMHINWSVGYKGVGVRLQTQQSQQSQPHQHFGGMESQDSSSNLDKDMDMDTSSLTGSAPSAPSRLRRSGTVESNVSDNVADGQLLAQWTGVMDGSQNHQKSFLESCGREQLIALLLWHGSVGRDQHVKTHELLHRTKSRLKIQQQKVRRLSTRLSKAKDTIEELKQPTLHDLDVKRNNSRRLSWRGMVALGLRKAIALISASSFPHASLVDVSRNTVIRAEVLTNAFLLARAALFHQLVYGLLTFAANLQTGKYIYDECENQRTLDAEMQSQIVDATTIQTGSSVNNNGLSQDEVSCSCFGLPRIGSIEEVTKMVSPGSEGSFMIGATSFSSDATNSSIFQRQKLQGLIVTSSVMKDWEKLQKLEYHDAFASLTSL